MRTFFGVLVVAALVSGFGGVAFAQTPTPAQCNAEAKACDIACNAADPKHSFSYAGCSAKCVARKAACDSEIVYDKSADWTKRQYDAAKPWVEDKIERAPANVEHTYPSNN